MGVSIIVNGHPEWSGCEWVFDWWTPIGWRAQFVSCGIRRTSCASTVVCCIREGGVKVAVTAVRCCCALLVDGLQIESSYGYTPTSNFSKVD